MPIPTVTIPRWRGQPPDLTPRRLSALRDLRAWEKHPSWDADRRDRAVSQSWGFFRHRMQQRRFHPYVVPPDAREALRVKGLGPTAVRVLELLVGARVGYGIRVVVGDHGQLAELLGVSERWAGEALRSLADADLVERRTHFRPAGLGHAQLACSWKLRRAALKLVKARFPAALGETESAKPTPFPPPDRGCSLTGGSRFHPPSPLGAPQALRRLERDLQHQVLVGVQRARRVYGEAVREVEARIAELPPASSSPGCAFHRGAPQYFRCLDCDAQRATREALT